MAWVKLDDRFWANRKVRRAWREPRAVGLYVMALCRANAEESDGFVDPEWAEMQIPDDVERDRVVTALVDVGLWEPFGDGWQIHDYHAYQPSKVKLEEVREARRLAGKLGGQKSGESRRANNQTPGR